jgi:CheY-like chemotaxis protein
MDTATVEEEQVVKRRVLVVDDHPDTARSYYELLHSMGHDCRFTTDAYQALPIARQLRPQLALLDIGLKIDLDGFDLAKALRAEFGHEVTLIAITAYGRDEDRHRTRKAGFDAHVTKPIDIGLLESILRSRM